MIILFTVLYLILFTWAFVSLGIALVKRNQRAAQVFAPLVFFALIGLLTNAASFDLALALSGVAGR